MLIGNSYDIINVLFNNKNFNFLSVLVIYRLIRYRERSYMIRDYLV